MNELTFHKALEKEMDGRTNRWLAKKTEIHESEISRIISGRLTPTDAQKEKIEAIFPTLKQE